MTDHELFHLIFTTALIVLAPIGLFFNVIHKFFDNRFQNRNIFSIAFVSSLIPGNFFLDRSQLSPVYFLKALCVGIVLGFPLALLGIHRIRKRIKGSQYLVKKRSFPFVALFIGCLVGLFAFVNTSKLPHIPGWLVFGLYIAVFFFSMSNFLFIHYLEGKIGKPIVEVEGLGN